MGQGKWQVQEGKGNKEMHYLLFARSVALTGVLKEGNQVAYRERVSSFHEKSNSRSSARRLLRHKENVVSCKTCHW